ncbi:MAG: gliding motility protein GldN [Bacteroidaceae bacterium]|nr:gliding motility protein GldN [Bacteroidaceae bacterium]
MLFFPLCTMAQPKQTRVQKQQAQASNANGMTNRAKIMFPTAQTMDENVVWRRDVYRELDLTKDANAALYFPVTPQGKNMNLFTYLFKLVLSGQVKAYQYKLDNNEDFTDSARIKPLRFLDDYHIFYEKNAQGRIRIDNSDIPSAEVKKYYIKESAYYDQGSASFHRNVTAICPIMQRVEDSWGGEDSPAQNYPLFWIRYSDVAPFLSKQNLMTSNVNNAATMSMDDFFTKNMYDGKIYKTVNMQGRTLMEYCKNDTALTAEQKRIEEEIRMFEKNIWGDQARKDSLDSIAKLDPKLLKANAKKQRKTRRSGGSSDSGKTVKTKQTAASNATITVRRQRH